MSSVLDRPILAEKCCAYGLSCFPFSGEKLDHKACEALEEIFKRVQFKMVDLEQTNLDEDVSSN